MHTYGHPCKINEIKDICCKYCITLIEDAAESVGSLFHGKHTGTFGHVGAMSFNGNKVITSGGGGCIVTNSKNTAELAKHLTTTAKLSHQWNFDHNMVGYNYRMPNLNAALLVAQLESLDYFIDNKRKLAHTYDLFFKNTEYTFVSEPVGCRSNYWLNSILFKNIQERNKFLEITNAMGVMTRPTWTLMNKLPMFKHAQCGDLKNSEWISDRLVNIPSSVIL
jgi:dTDP-4-amino-4,6-dideoxygalactose transaminase